MPAPLTGVGDRQCADESPARQFLGFGTQRTGREGFLQGPRRMQRQGHAALEQRGRDARPHDTQTAGDHGPEAGGDPFLERHATVGAVGAVGRQDPWQPVGALRQHQDQQFLEARPIVVDPGEQQLRGGHQFAIG